MGRKRARQPARKLTGRFRRADLILRFWQEIPSRSSAINRVVSRVLRVARAMECAKGELQGVELALREALGNAILHGSGGDARKKVAVGCLCDARKGLLLIVRDAGQGFDPSQVPDPTLGDRVFGTHGRGIFLMRQLMDEVGFQKGGREVVMLKEPPPAHPRRSRRGSTRRGAAYANASAHDSPDSAT